ncbi:adenylate cyclase (plasmid) [Microvirga ossetica]|uniref:Adenylate cyclase n=1 Tax=Microvirga ossetica TaxID=1882682 RepID=A0A1B2EUN2_9HYPH|nr:adenylate/guanylate cyclase domain-containing protein [Microvirga ossetica]ANY83674.1 adenylate cyclase [Microvirga ossetica]
MATAWVERRLVAILAADVVGYSHLVEMDEAGTLAALKALRREVIDPLLAEHHGRIVKLMGDGALAEFGSVVDAVACAVAVQKGVADRQDGVLPERRIVFRIGINLGDVVVEGDDLLGDGVNIAARLEQICEPGGVLISGTAYDHLQGKIDLLIEFAGEQRVKNIERPIRTYRIRRGTSLPGVLSFRLLTRRGLAAAAAILLLTGGAVGWWLWPAAPAYASKPSIAVLPFNNLGGDEATTRLADGITEDIITDLARFPEFEVVSRNSTGIYRGKAVDVRQVGKDLGVGYVLEGSFQREGERLRATVQLIDAKTGTHLWSNRWDRAVEEVFALQTDLAEQVANRLGSGAGLIQEAGRKAAKRKRPDNLGAYELYLLGTERLEQSTKDSNDDAVRLLRQAVTLDPTLARAWIELSWAYLGTVGFGADETTGRRAARDAAERAVALDPSDAEAHAAMGNAFGQAGDFVRAEAEYEESLRLNPGSAEILTFYAGWASSFGKPERGAEAADRAIRLNPHHLPWHASQFSYAYFNAGRYDDALHMIERRTPDQWSRGFSVRRAAVFAALGRIDEANAAVAETLKRFPGITIQGYVSTPDWSEAERQRLIETMRKAGFPACAPPETLAKLVKPVSLPECTQPRAAN